MNMGVSEAPKLPIDWVDLWWEDIDSQIKRIPEFWDALLEDERKRARRFRFDRHRERFIVQRGRLREILSGYWNGVPKAIRFRQGPGGKPAVKPTPPKQLRRPAGRVGTIPRFVSIFPTAAGMRSMLLHTAGKWGLMLK